MLDLTKELKPTGVYKLIETNHNDQKLYKVDEYNYMIIGPTMTLNSSGSFCFAVRHAVSFNQAETLKFKPGSIKVDTFDKALKLVADNSWL